jgi:hypothetical protein
MTNLREHLNELETIKRDIRGLEADATKLKNGLTLRIGDHSYEWRLVSERSESESEIALRLTKDGDRYDYTYTEACRIYTFLAIWLSDKRDESTIEGVEQ